MIQETPQTFVGFSFCSFLFGATFSFLFFLVDKAYSFSQNIFLKIFSRARMCARADGEEDIYIFTFLFFVALIPKKKGLIRNVSEEIPITSEEIPFSSEEKRINSEEINRKNARFWGRKQSLFMQKTSFREEIPFSSEVIAINSEEIPFSSEEKSGIHIAWIPLTMRLYYLEQSYLK